MGKRIIQQARGKGSFTYRVKRKAYKFKIAYPQKDKQGEAIVIKLLNSAAHTSPLAKIKIGDSVFYNPAAQGLYEGQKILIGGDNVQQGSIVEIGNVPIGTKVFNVERRPGDGGKLIRTSGGFSTVLKKNKDEIIILTSRKKQIKLNKGSRATIGVIAGQGRKTKPVVKAGKKWHMMKAKNRLWPRTSPIKVNAIDHPFGGGRGKRIKSKIAKRNAPAGAKVGTIKPRRTGKKKK